MLFSKRCRSHVRSCSPTSALIVVTKEVRMAQSKKPRSGKAAKKHSAVPFSFDVDDAIVEARTAIDDELLEHLNTRLQIFGEKGLVAADISDGLLISVLKLVASNGKYPMERGRFWQILDRCDPSSSFKPEDAIRTRLSGEIESLFAAAENESFEDGFDSVLSLELQRLVLRYGDMTLEIVSDLLREGRVAPQVAAEALACVGEMRNEATYAARRQLLERSLESPSHVTRDGAVAGLSNLCDPRTIGALQAAAQREDYRLLRTNMLNLLEYLRGLQP
jgi:hypothetical protein